MRKRLFWSLAAVSSILIALIAWHLWPPAPATPALEVASTEAPAELASAQPPPQVQSETVAVRPRDTFVAVLLRHGISSATAHEIAAALTLAGANLRAIRPGDELQLTRQPSGRLVKLGYRVDPWTRFDADETSDGWHVSAIAAVRDTQVEVRQGEVRQSLWDAVDSGRLSASALLALVQIFESEFDFSADTQPGDRFRLLIEARYADGVFVDYGRILAVQYFSDGKTLTGVGFAEEGGFRHYDAEGRSLRKMFLRSPLEFTRISSGFTYRRPHPVLGGVRPHLAIDYAAPTGTPVWAVADGVVKSAGYKGGNGIQVRLQHRGGYETYYNHLSRLAAGIRAGVRVKQKQVIGRVGSTGLSTGPHLDYRVSQNGKFVNPLNEKFVPGEPIARAKRDDFVAQASALIERLEREAPFQL